LDAGTHLLVLATDSVTAIEDFRLHLVDLSQKSETDLGEVAGIPNVAWAEPGKSVYFSRTISGLTNIWKFSLKDKSLSQVTFGTGPDLAPMPDPAGKGLYLVNGKSSGFLTLYNVARKTSTDISSENATQPAISRDGKRVMYITIPANDRMELWVANIDGSNKTKLSTAASLSTGSWAQDNFHLNFTVEEAGKPNKVYVAGADGSGLRALNWAGGTIQVVKKCTPLVPGVVTFSILFARDGKSFLYAIPSRHDVTIYRQNWQAGNVVGQRQVSLKLPFAFPLVSGGNAYDITRDLSTVVYARPGGHAELYLLSPK
jgi:Tol biopolymer transport system component